MNRGQRIASSIVGRVWGEPAYLVFFVTARCNARCSHCFLPGLSGYDESGRSDLSLDEIRRIARTLPRISELSLTGGEPFLREDLADIARALVESGRIRHLRIMTNGWFTDAITGTVAALLRTDVRKLSVRVSLDGPASVHDIIRGRDGLYETALETIRRLVSTREREPRLRIGTLTTYQAANREHLAGWLTELWSLRVDTTSLIRLRGTPRDPGSLTGVSSEFDVLDREFRGLNPSAFRRAYKSIVHELRTGRLRGGCVAGTLTAVLRENGDLYACEPLFERMASLREHDLDFASAWASPSAQRVREQVAACAGCTYECALPFTVVTDPAILARFGWRVIRETISR